MSKSLSLPSENNDNQRESSAPSPQHFSIVQDQQDNLRLSSASLGLGVEIKLTESADGILDVTPVSSPTNDLVPDVLDIDDIEHMNDPVSFHTILNQQQRSQVQQLNNTASQQKQKTKQKRKSRPSSLDPPSTRASSSSVVDASDAPAFPMDAKEASSLPPDLPRVPGPSNSDAFSSSSDEDASGSKLVGESVASFTTSLALSAENKSVSKQTETPGASTDSMLTATNNSTKNEDRKHEPSFVTKAPTVGNTMRARINRHHSALPDFQNEKNVAEDNSVGANRVEVRQYDSDEESNIFSQVEDSEDEDDLDLTSGVPSSSMDSSELPVPDKGTNRRAVGQTDSRVSAKSSQSASSNDLLQQGPSTMKRAVSQNSLVSGAGSANANSSVSNPPFKSLKVYQPQHTNESSYLSSGVLPDVLMTMRQKIESLTMFDSDMMRLAATSGAHDDDDPLMQESRESLKRSSQQSISAAVLVSLAHKRYERRRLAAMEIEKVVRSLVAQGEFDRVRAILLLLSDDYVRSTSEDARKGGVVALAACAIGMKKVKDSQDSAIQECRDLILASVVHACQDHSQRVRYYACENLCNTVKVIPLLAIQHFFILFEILRSLYADVSIDVRKGAEILDRKMKEIIVDAMNSGSLSAESCVPVFARFVYLRNKPTKRLTLTWLQELSEKLIGSPILEYLHLFLGGIFDMIGDPTVAIRQAALAFLQSVLPKLLNNYNDTPIEEGRGTAVNFDKILQSLVTTMEHPDPFVRKVAMYWMSRIVKAHIGPSTLSISAPPHPDGISHSTDEKKVEGSNGAGAPSQARWSTQDEAAKSAASVSVRNSVPHVLPGVLLSIGDTYTLQPKQSNANTFLPDQSTRALAEQTNTYLQEAVKREGSAYVQHLDGFIVALREELDTPGGLIGKNAPAVERTPYRIDVNSDGSGIESPGWFRGNSSTESGQQRLIRNNSSDNPASVNNESTVLSRLCALHWIIVLYENVVPDLLKADYAREFVFAIIHQLVDNPPKSITYKSLEVLAKITVPVSSEETKIAVGSGSLSSKFSSPAWAVPQGGSIDDSPQLPMNEPSIEYALDILGSERRSRISRDREVFSALIQMHSANQELLADLTSVLTYMCQLQPSEFVMVSFAVELDRFVRKRKAELSRSWSGSMTFANDLRFASSFVQHMNHVLLNSEEAKGVREVLKDCVGSKGNSERDRQRSRIFHILLHSFSHNLGSVLSLCLWSGAFRTASLFLNEINPLDINLMLFLEIDRLVEMLERPLFRHIHIRMLERDADRTAEGSGNMLFKTLKYLLMILPQSACYHILRERLNSITRFRQSTHLSSLPASDSPKHNKKNVLAGTELYVQRVVQVRKLHCDATWHAIRAESFETPDPVDGEGKEGREEGADRRAWLGYESKEEEQARRTMFRTERTMGLSKMSESGVTNSEGYDDLQLLSGDKPAAEFQQNTESTSSGRPDSATIKPQSQLPSISLFDSSGPKEEERWKHYWMASTG